MKNRSRVWTPFSKEAYRWAWKDKKIVGIVKEFRHDILRCHQRIWHGYCDYDLYSIFDWFLRIMPDMLQDFRNDLHGYPLMGDDKTFEISTEEDDKGMDAWIAVLDQMIFLLKEADEETCSRLNPFEEEHDKAVKEFTQKYGSHGDKLLTEEEIRESENGLGTRWYWLSDVPEYKYIDEKYMNEDRKITAYRRKCKDEALELFSKWFYDLWD